MIQELISRYKRMRTEHYLCQTFQHAYAFIGMGQHSLTNLYPVLHYLGVPLKYICVTSERKAKLIEKKFMGVKATTSLDEILNDENVKGVFVAATPTSHFSIATQVLQSGKSLFIEKPPCQTLEQLDTLIDLQQKHRSPVVMVGLQKRYAPVVHLLKKRLDKEHLVSYDLHYLMGAYPEGNALLDLYIHPLDLIVYLFGMPEIIACRKVYDNSYIIMLQHPQIVGTLELSTHYSWTNPKETLKICTRSGVYRLSQMEELSFTPKPPVLFGIPFEKMHHHQIKIENLFIHNNFTPILSNNQVYTQGYFNCISAFVNAIEGNSTINLTSLSNIRNTYTMMAQLQNECFPQ